ncbi:aminotransferase class I/II-fold pyridoxal phosphate-dependent enzyme [Methylocapsa palsarum]|uniref:8-amino-7-oxononanoate synthase n=1 Tax=Methylocapsa palsarum TaxID=1612308 RepID=A0A1I4AS81_9HYPH|nr:aminotransferase class I/II-fold pyridoxal phosphate-dependent enzyme [Methylocapsa palsarum]SFK58817.1 8-amino-7-oxononanoate synthase [Methylocapsa palsarum]
MLDFTSSLYLGLRHSTGSLRPWAQLTTGRPAALETTPEAIRAGDALARLLQVESAVLAPSTLHLYCDLFEVLASEPIAIYTDAGAYPTVRWGIERAAAKGVPVAMFEMRDAAALERLLRRDHNLRRRPVVVTDGLCVETGRTAPLPDYVKLARERNGYVVVDDTQAFGLLGEKPTNSDPFGTGGGGTPAFLNVRGPELIIGNSLAKSFGAPLAVLGGDGRVISKFVKGSATRVHSSPPSQAAISAAERALDITSNGGENLRRRLAALVRSFRAALRQIGLSTRGGMFPVQTMEVTADVEPRRLYGRLLDLGVRAVLRQARNMFGAAIAFVITTLHSLSDIDRCAEALERALAPARTPQRRALIS